MPEQAAKGWTVATYEGFALGWINALASRINNYYPKELRIIKDSQAS
jgi:NOL1/NOP2/fmu family ribosome biogenesis protein